MTKVSRNILKDIVKECLVEILSEGLSTTAMTAQQPDNSTHRQPAQKRRAVKERSHPSSLMQINDRQDKKNEALERKIISAAGGNNIMESILRDTAQNTLPTMMAAESKGSSNGMVERMTRGDTATRVMAEADPMDVFEGSSKWAALAFQNSTQPKER